MVEALIFWALAMYGAVTIIWQAVRGIQLRTLRHDHPQPMNVVLVVQNAEDSIEGVLRSLLDRTVFSLRERTVTVVDAWSYDETGTIVERLSASRPALSYIHTANEQELQQVLQRECVERAAIACVYDLRRGVGTSEVLQDLATLCR